ncbi:hypothetical protein GGR55DRAFT_647863 [Xylaria sp. FL0064]|nr:hypothetical protein GGR55DRAFT_647863 [Xylaria sp. FL0064]
MVIPRDDLVDESVFRALNTESDMVGEIIKVSKSIWSSVVFSFPAKKARRPDNLSTMATTQRVLDQMQTSSSSPPSSSSSTGPTTTTRDAVAADNHEVQNRHGPFETILDWVLLAGSIVFPEIFSPLNRMGILTNPVTGTAVQFVIRNMPRRYLAGYSCLLFGFGMAWLWWTIRYNYLWLLSRIFV